MTTQNKDNNQQDPNRSIALKWWNELIWETKLEYYKGYTPYTSASSYHELTGREIQNIWAVITNPPETPTPVEVEVNIENKEAVKSLYLANVKDYALVNADESFRDGIEVGYWGAMRMHEQQMGLMQMHVNHVKALLELVQFCEDCKGLYMEGSLFDKAVKKAKAAIQKNKDK